MKRLLAVCPLIAWTGFFVAEAAAPAGAATTITRVVAPDASVRSVSAEGRMVLVAGAGADRLIDRDTGVSVVVPFRGGVLSPDGAHVLYAAPEPAATALDVYRYDVVTHASTLLTGDLSDARSYVPVAASLDASVVGIDASSGTPDDRHALVLDTRTHVLTTPDSSLAPGSSFDVSLSHDGTRAAFTWLAAAGSSPQIYVYDGVSATDVLVTESPLDEPSTRHPRDATISVDGTHVVYVSDAGDVPPELDSLDPADVAAGTDATVLLYDIDDDRTVTIAHSSVAGVDDAPSVDASGTRVAFLKLARTDPPVGPSGLAAQLFVRDLEVGATTQISVGAGGVHPNGPVTAARLAADGRALLWDSTATNLVVPASGSGRAVYATALASAPVCTITGGPGRDTLTGTSKADVICGLGGDDTIRGLGGNDIIRGGAGNDVMVGGAGNDQLQGGDGNDSGDGGAGADSLDGGGGRDELIGGPGDDWLDGGDGNDVLRSASGNDVVLAGSGNDVIDAGSGNDRIFGGDGNDVIDAGAGDDAIDAGEGNDLVRASTGDDLVYGRGGRDDLAGLGGRDRLYGGRGDDTIEGGADDDRLDGGDGRDELKGAGGRDVVTGGLGNDSLTGGAGDDQLGGGDGNDTEAGGPGNDDLHGDDGADNLQGNGGNDRLYGDDGRDTLNGGAGADALDGGPLADTCRSGGGGGTMVNCEA